MPKSSRSRSWMWMAAGIVAGVLVHGVAGWWTAPAFAQAGNTTFTTSTTNHTSFESPPACSPVGSSRTAVSASTTVSLGPGTIFIGPDQSQTFFVAAGTTNFNTNTHTETFQCVAAVPALPRPAFIATALGAAGLGAWMLTRRRRRPA